MDFTTEPLNISKKQITWVTTNNNIDYPGNENELLNYLNEHWFCNRIKHHYNFTRAVNGTFEIKYNWRDFIIKAWFFLNNHIGFLNASIVFNLLREAYITLKLKNVLSEEEEEYFFYVGMLLKSPDEKKGEFKEIYDFLWSIIINRNYYYNEEKKLDNMTIEELLPVVIKRKVPKKEIDEIVIMTKSVNLCYVYCNYLSSINEKHRSDVIRSTIKLFIEQENNKANVVKLI
ncbi:hypothetical protein [Salmon gill poxvirus]|uniref:Uncharacterized protein n=1 Tax=Salmon gill poxvirus TaxID=1680908 RepID=A0A0H4XWD5_9POXV|nr:hypothetical protein AL387_gp029 [Salmon gill poxvirus]AKR04153.1 hypothetical protein SGPV029 [Salmon gill poxvirus]